MSGPATPAQDERRKTAGSRMLALGGVFAAIGIAIMILGDGWGADGWGVLGAVVGTLLTVVGAVLVVSTFVARRSARGKPFA
jgi:drug/metabolite transporter superfamily protein YnfA